jgi:hypothetical protein
MSRGLTPVVVLLSALACGLLMGCAKDKGRPPIARLSVEPRFVPAGVEAIIDLDGRRSCDEIEYPETCDKTLDGSGPPSSCPGGVTFRWSLDQDFVPVGGEDAMTQPFAQVRVIPDRPITVTLAVTDCDGNVVTNKTQVGIIIEYPTGDATP